MSTVRTLPIRVTPIEGEALDSWLEALAHRTHTAFGDLLSAVGLSPYHGMGTSAWIVQLTLDEKAMITAATGITHARLETMTLAHYAGSAVRINNDTRTLSRAFPWGRTRGSRFCPLCLEETGGRWQLAWRLGWTFACIDHHCLLADACPHCGAVQRRRTHVGDLIPTAGRCAHPAASAIGRKPARCDTELTAAPVTVFDADHPAILAQRIINAVIADETATFGVYRIMPQPRFNALADIRAVAGRALAYATPQDLVGVITRDLHAAFREASRHEDLRSGPARTDAKPGLAAPARAATAAVGVVTALTVLDRPEVAAAGDALRWLVTSSRERGSAVHATNIAWGKNTSPVLTGVQLAALGPFLNPSDQLRYRIGTPLPTHPTTATSHTSALVRRLPSVLWPAWSLPMSIPGCHQRHLRPALSISLLLINSRLNLDEAASLIASPIDGQAVSRVLQLLERHYQWPNIRAGLTRMAEYFADSDVPIDYQRRRQLDYRTLLPDEVWARICRDTGTPGPRLIRAKIARCLLFERVSGLSAPDAPFALADNAFHTKVADFPQHLTPELIAALEEHAKEFLADQGVGREPVTWAPPAGVLDGLVLPGARPDAVDVAELHRLIGADGMTLGAAAARLHTNLDTVRHLLETHPTPRPSPPLGAQSTPAHNRAYCRAKTALPRERLVDLYQCQQMSLGEIAATVGVSRQIIGRIAHDYDVELREPGRRARVIINRDWLHDQYVNKRRTLPDLATETGMSTANMARWAKTHDIPLRARGGPSHSAALSTTDNAERAPELLRPALAGMGGRERLERFVAASSHETLTVAAEKLDIHQFTLVNQINRIEREFGMKLLIRAERGRPMQLTEHGARVVAAVRSCQRLGW